MTVDIGNDGIESAPLHGHTEVFPNIRTPLALNGPFKLTRSICIRAAGPMEAGPGEGGGNSMIVYVGGPEVESGHTANGGCPLAPGESITLPCRDLGKVFVTRGSGGSTGPTLGQWVSWSGV
jgi:hypothetical protein